MQDKQKNVDKAIEDAKGVLDKARAAEAKSTRATKRIQAEYNRLVSLARHKNAPTFEAMYDKVDKAHPGLLPKPQPEPTPAPSNEPADNPNHKE